MARYSREEILHLRQSPIIVYHTPPLPDWISADAISAAQNKALRSTERQSAVKNGRPTDDASSNLFTRVGKGDRQDSGNNKNLHETFRERSDRSDMKSSDRDRGVKHDGSSRGVREPRRPEDGTEPFSTRRTKGIEAAAGPRNSRKQEYADVNSQKKMDMHAADEPEWFSRPVERSETPDTSVGKTVDDFERWKKSMKKNDGSGDTGLPPLQDMNNNNMEPAPFVRSIEDEPKDVKPPPGFAGIVPIPRTERTDQPNLVKGVFDPLDTGAVDRPDMPSRAETPSETKLSAAGSTAAPSAIKHTGSSKFSKFFNQSAQAPRSPSEQPRLEKELAQSVSDTNILGSNPAASSRTEDAAGFERILAMLSTQSIAVQPKAQTAVPPLFEQNYHAGHYAQDPSVYKQQDRHPRVVQHPPSMPAPQYTMDNFKSLAIGGEHDFPSLKPNDTASAIPAIDRSRTQGAYDTDNPSSNATMGFSSGSSSIMNHHTQNQDFFSSLLSQSQSNHMSQKEVRPPPSQARHLPPGQSMHFDARMQQPHPVYPPAQQQQTQFLQQPRAPPYHTQEPPHNRGPSRNEYDNLERMMTAPSLHAIPPPPSGPYSPPEHPQYVSRDQYPGIPGPGGHGQRPGHAWHGPFDVDPRLPNSNQHYRP